MFERARAFVSTFVTGATYGTGTYCSVTGESLGTGVARDEYGVPLCCKDEPETPREQPSELEAVDQQP